MSTSTALPRLHRAALAAVAGSVLVLTTLAAVNAAFASTSGEHADRPAHHRPAHHRVHHRAHHPRPRTVVQVAPVTPVAPVTVASDDWRCDEPADEKFICSLGEASVVVTWRRAAEHEEYLSIAKGGGTIFVSDVHGPFFATVMGGAETPQAQVDEVGGLLAWR